MSYQNPKFGTNLGLPINIFRKLTPTDKRTGGWLNLKNWWIKMAIEIGLIPVDPCCSTATQLNSIETGITTAGSDQATAYPLTKQFNNLTVVATSTGALLPVMGVGSMIIVKNSDAGDTALVYPQVGVTINALGQNSAYSLAVGKTAVFIGTSDTTITCFNLN